MSKTTKEEPTKEITAGPASLWVSAFGQGFSAAWAVRAEKLVEIGKRSYQEGYDQCSKDQRAAYERKRELLIQQSSGSVSHVQVARAKERLHDMLMAAERKRHDPDIARIRAKMEVLDEMLGTKQD